MYKLSRSAPMANYTKQGKRGTNSCTTLQTCNSSSALNGNSSVRRFRANRQLPIRTDKVAGVAVGKMLQIVLMIGLGFPERSGRRDFGHDFPRPQSGGIDIGDRVFGDALLLLACIEDSGAIARSDIVALAVARAGIVDLEEKLQNSAIADLRRVEGDFDRLGMGAVVSVGGVRHVTACIADASRNHAVEAPDEILHSPKTTTRK